MRFTWKGCDSAPAAPMVIDLARLREFAHRSGEKGARRHPWGGTTHHFGVQMDQLAAYAAEHRARSRRPVRQR